MGHNSSGEFVSAKYCENKNPSKNEIFVITGTTAVGKTELSLRYAEENNAEILSCDSTNVYHGMDIGTAKPTPCERSRVVHHGIDLIEPNEKFSVGDYLSFAVPCVAEIFSRGKNVLVTGGSGFYLKSFYAPVTDEIAISEKLRSRVANILSRGDVFASEQLRALNPDGAPKFDWENPRRVARALERCLASGKTISELKAEMELRKSPFSNYKIRTILLRRSQEDLNERITLRVKQMINLGLVSEIKMLQREHGLRKDTPAGNAIGYRETIQWLESGEPGGIPALTEAIALSTRQLAAKQRKWFRTQIPVDEIRDL